MADPSDKQKPWRRVEEHDDIDDLFSDDDDQIPTAMVSRKVLGQVARSSQVRSGRRTSHGQDAEFTIVDYRMPDDARLPFQDTALVTAEQVLTRASKVPAPSPALDTEELFLDDLHSLFDDSSDEDDTPQPALPASSGGRVAMGKRKPALPLPAPPVKPEPAPMPGVARPGSPERQTLAGTRRSRLNQYSLANMQRNVPVAVDEDDDRSTAVAKDPLAPLKTPLIGGRYRIVERIGAGGMGKVYKVTHAQLGKTFALKIISQNLADDDKIRELFYREARMASSLSHPNIATVLDFGEDKKLGAFMVMEFIEGEPLAKRLHREGRMSTRMALDIIRQAAEALDYIHAQGIVHCDIKTENILLVDVSGAGQQRRSKIQVKLLDFGLARSTVADRNTASLAGTPHYVAPERIRGAQAAPSSDIYGLGILFYELLTGKVPWDGTVDQILHGHLNMAPTPPSQLIDGGLDPALEKLVLRALAKTREERHKDMAAFLYELQTVMDMLGYGRPGRRKRGAAKRVVNRPGNQRDELARALFDASRVPMALISRDGIIQVANAAFAQFIMGVYVDVEGLNVQSTPLVAAWATFETDLSRACAGTSVRRTIHVDTASARSRRLLMWLDPGVHEDQAIFGVHPLEEG